MLKKTTNSRTYPGNRMRYLAFLLPVLCLLTACDSRDSLRHLRVVDPVSDPYYKALAKRYAEYAQTEEDNYDWWTSKYFADKGLLAAYGKQITPEDPENWSIALADMPALQDARAKLMRALDAGAATRAPQDAARAVAQYDCWVEQEDDGWKLDRIEACRDDFFAALGALNAAPAPAADSVPPAPKTPDTTSSILYFPFDSDALEVQGEGVLQQLVTYILAAGKVDIVINGHADRAGSDAYNMKLSERRAKFVRAALLRAGVPEERIHYFAFGESDPKVPTDDGVKEPANRRVEIFLE